MLAFGAIQYDVHSCGVSNYLLGEQRLRASYAKSRVAIGSVLAETVDCDEQIDRISIFNFGGLCVSLRPYRRKGD